MQTKEYLEFRDKCRSMIQQDMATVTDILEMMDKIFDMGEIEGLRQIETKLSPEDLEAFRKAIDEPVRLPQRNQSKNWARVRRAN